MEPTVQTDPPDREHGELRAAADLLHSVVHGQAWVPWIRLTVTLAVLAVVLVVLALLLRP